MRDESNAAKLVENRLRVDYELPLGGAHLAYRAAEAGHDVVLCGPKLDLSEESKERLESVGVELETDDSAQVRGMVRCMYTPFGCTVEIARRLIDDVREEAVLRTTCTCPPIALYHDLERKLRADRGTLVPPSFTLPGSRARKLETWYWWQTREPKSRGSSWRRRSRSSGVSTWQRT